jgi:hypothetical protein
MKKIWLLLLAVFGIMTLARLKAPPCPRTRDGIPDPDAPHSDWQFDGW